MSYAPEIEITFDPFDDGQELRSQWTSHRSLGELATVTGLTVDRPVDIHAPVAKNGIEVYEVTSEENIQSAQPKKMYPGSKGIRIIYGVSAARV